MKELTIIIKPEKLETVKEILDTFHCGGMSISSIMGCGTQRGMIGDGNGTNVIKGLKTNINLLPKIQITVVVDDDSVEDIITDIVEKVGTGTTGDGKIFIRKVEEVIRIRTGERGKKAL
ncbi:MAG: P-II family nitrogen regulator [Clostridiales bacterium]|nr:P-II family nitrogen regulator [Clostridiales bacterium]